MEKRPAGGPSCDARFAAVANPQSSNRLAAAVGSFSPAPLVVPSWGDLAADREAEIDRLPVDAYPRQRPEDLWSNQAAKRIISAEPS